MKRTFFFFLAIIMAAGVAYAGGPPDPLTIATDPGADSFTDDWIAKGHFNISISGTFVGTVTVQRSFDMGSNWVTVAQFTDEIETTGYEPAPGGRLWRIGILDTDYTSGSVTVRLDK